MSHKLTEPIYINLYDLFDVARKAHNDMQTANHDLTDRIKITIDENRTCFEQIRKNDLYEDNNAFLKDCELLY